MRTTRIVAAILLAVGVGCGAFGAHSLRELVDAKDLAIWEKGVLYHLLHSLGALVVSALAPAVIPETSARRIAVLLLCSVLVFSGTLYLLVLTQQRWLGAITPLGGTGFIVGWLALTRALVRS